MYQYLKPQSQSKAPEKEAKIVRSQKQIHTATYHQRTPVQFLRLRLNDEDSDTPQFNRLRLVDVSPLAHRAESNTPAAPGLQQANTPHVSGVPWYKRVPNYLNRLDEYGPPTPAGTPTLAE